MAKILVVEDEKIVAWDIQEALEKSGHTVVASVASGLKAIETAATMAPDLVLMDIRLKGQIDGIEAARSIYHRFDIPIVYLTAHAEDQTIQRASDTSPFGYLIKPFKEKELHTTIQIALHRYQIERGLKAGQEPLTAETQQTQLELQQQNSRLEQFQLSLLRQLEERNIYLQQTNACLQILKQAIGQIYNSSDDSQIFSRAVQELGQAFKADYCWLSFYDPKQAVATLMHEFIQDERSSAVGMQIPLDQTPHFYHKLFQRDCWIAPSLNELPIPYHPLITPNSQILVCPVWDEQTVIGDLGVVTAGQLPWSSFQADLITQLMSQCAIALQQARLHQPPQASMGELDLLNYLKDDFISSVSHELRTPLTNMRMAVEMLQRICLSLKSASEISGASNEQQWLWQKLDQYLQILQEEWHREFNLISDLLNFQGTGNSSESLAFGTIDLGQWLPHLVDRFSEQANRQGQALSCQVASDLAPVLSHASSLERIVTELLTNACKYTPQGYAITVTAGKSLSGEQFVLTVTNEGVEIPAEELTKIFQPFYRIPRQNPWNYSGMGLGLALVQKLVHRLKGQVQASSEAGKTALIVQLPVQQWY
jgi:signal transduction histidine kinase/DNA-binding response OmpR family regulator